MWFAIQTMTGREQDMIDLLVDLADRQSYHRVFFIRRETVWRREGRCIVHTEALFPGYVFVESDDPEKLYMELKKIPKFSKMLGKEEITGGADDDGILFHNVSPDEQEFLENLIDGNEDCVVRLSTIELDDNSNIIRCEGPLRHYQDKIVKKRVRLRYVMIRISLLGRTRDIKLGIRIQKERMLNMLDMAD